MFNSLWVSNLSTLKNINPFNIHKSNVHSQRLENSIEGTVNNCVIAQSCQIGKDVQLTNCVVLNGAVLLGHLEFQDCIIGSSVFIDQKQGKGVYKNCCFRFKYQNVAD